MNRNSKGLDLVANEKDDLTNSSSDIRYSLKSRNISDSVDNKMDFSKAVKGA